MKNSLAQQVNLFLGSEKLELEQGAKLGPISVAYESYGKLNSQKSNAVLICHALSGDAHVHSSSKADKENPGWWENYVGPGKAIDTNRYFVICSNVLGGCKGTTGPNSVDPQTKKAYGLRFPVITIADMVKVQKALIDKLKIDRLLAVIGGSMGGMQALEWSILFPDKIDKAIVLAATSKLSPQALAFDAVGRNAIVSDPNWAEGDYYGKKAQPEKGLAIARMIGHITYLSHESMNQKFGRKLQTKDHYGFNFDTDFQVESYLKYQGEKFVIRFDANSYLYLTKAISYFDLEKKYGSLKKAFQTATSKFLIMAINSDWLYPPQQSKEIVKALLNLKKDVTYIESDSTYGHDAFLLPDNKIETGISNFLKR